MRAARRRADVTMLSQGSPAAVGSFDDKRGMAQQDFNLAIPDGPVALDDAVKAAVDAAKGAADATPTVLDATSAAAGAAPAAADSTTALAQIAADAQKAAARITAQGAANVAEVTARAQTEAAQITANGAEQAAQITADGADKVAHTSGDALTLSSTINAEALMWSSTINAEALIFVAIVGFVGMAVSRVSNDDPIRTKVKQLTPPRWSEANDAKSLYASLPTSWTKTLPSESPSPREMGKGENNGEDCAPILRARDHGDIEKFIPPSGPSEASEVAVPNQYICSITAEIMTDPVNTVHLSLP